MDPTQLLINADQAISDGELEEARELLQHYRNWRAKKGFEPRHDLWSVHGRPAKGDTYATYLEDRISCYK